MRDFFKRFWGVTVAAEIEPEKGPKLVKQFQLDEGLFNEFLEHEKELEGAYTALKMLTVRLGELSASRSELWDRVRKQYDLEGEYHLSINKKTGVISVYEE